MSENEKAEKIGAGKQADKAAKSADKKAKASKKDTKPSFFQRISRWLREMKSELKKVVWPTPKQTMNNTVVVIVCVIVVGICIWAFDWLAGQIIAALLHLFGKS